MAQSPDLPLIQKHMPELDVLRGIAILVVLLYHGFYWSGAATTNGPLSGFYRSTIFGWLGVNLFFVLSGFLITGILIAAKGSDTFYRRFYFRRAVRILPAYLAVLIVLGLIGWMTVKSTAVYLLFLANYSEFFHVGSYGPLWSLSVEEQFYLVWPALVGRVRVRTLAIISIVLCLVEPLLRWVSSSGHVYLGDVHSATNLIADNLAMGALAAIFARSRFGTLRNGVWIGAGLCVLGCLMLLAGYPFGILHRTNLFGATFQAIPWNFFFTGVLLLSLGIRSPLAASQWTAPFRFLGYVSYGLYLVHLLIFVGYDSSMPHISGPGLQHFLRLYPVRFVLAGGASILLAWLSRKFYEEPFLKIGKKQ